MAATSPQIPNGRRRQSACRTGGGGSSISVSATASKNSATFQLRSLEKVLPGETAVLFYCSSLRLKTDTNRVDKRTTKSRNMNNPPAIKPIEV
jgi:hypothetical protein